MSVGESNELNFGYMKDSAYSRPAMRILLVEDNDPLRATVQEALCEEGMTVDVAENGEVGLYHATEYSYDLIVLDVMMPKLDGWQVLTKLRDRGNAVPVIMLTARDEVEDRVQGLDLGADDYLVKPFRLAELSARIRSVIRRARGNSSPVVQCQDIEIDTGKQEVRRSGQVVDLTAFEYKVLDCLLSKRGEVVSRSHLYLYLFSDEKEVASNILDVYICNLRKKLGGELVKTKRGAGYYID